MSKLYSDSDIDITFDEPMGADLERYLKDHLVKINIKVGSKFVSWTNPERKAADEESHV